MIRILLASLALLSTTGCSTLGLSLYPSGHFLTKQSAAVLRAAPASAPLPKELNMSVVEEHFLQPGDSLLIEPIEFNPDVRLPADQQVMADGTIDLGGFGRLQVAGMTIEAAEAAIEHRLVAMQAEPAQVNVQLLNGVERYYILGEVQSPGAYPLVGNETVLDGILQAGGLTDRAAPCRILMARPTVPASCRITLPICYHQIAQLGDTTTNYQLQPGDRVFVASRTCMEELMFWRAGRTCERCAQGQAPCCHPEMNVYQNPIGPMLPAGPPLPAWSQDPDGDTSIEELGPPQVRRTPLPDTPLPDTPLPDTPAPQRSPEVGELDFDRPLPPLPGQSND